MVILTVVSVDELMAISIVEVKVVLIAGDECIDGCHCGWVDDCLDEIINTSCLNSWGGWIDGCHCGWGGGCLDEIVDRSCLDSWGGCIDGCHYGWSGGCLDEIVDTSFCLILNRRMHQLILEMGCLWWV